MQNNQQHHEDFSVFVESIHEALPEFIHHVEKAGPHQLSAQRNFFLKEFQILMMLAEYFPKESQEKKACDEIVNQWLIIDKELAKTPVDLKNIKIDVDTLQKNLRSLIQLTGGGSWMKY